MTSSRASCSAGSSGVVISDTGILVAEAVITHSTRRRDDAPAASAFTLHFSFTQAIPATERSAGKKGGDPFPNVPSSTTATHLHPTGNRSAVKALQAHRPRAQTP